MKNRGIRLVVSILITAAFMGLLVFATNATYQETKSYNRILVMLGGQLPAGLIQGFTYLLFVYGMLECTALKKKLDKEARALSQKLLPETENWVLSVDDANQLKLDIQEREKTSKSYLTDLIKKACAKYRLSKSSSEALDVADTQINVFKSELDGEQSFVRYVAWAIPSVGFIGTVIGIAASLGYANEAGTTEGIDKMTGMLAVAFDTTLVALVLSLFLMYFIHSLQKKQDSFFAKLESYLIENLINRFYK